MQPPQPVIVSGLFPILLDELVTLLESLSKTEWDLPTVCSPWSVKDIALHLLGGDMGILSWKRDGYSSFPSINSWDHLVSLINKQNELWIEGTQRLSPHLITQLLKFTGDQVSSYFQSLGPYIVGSPVDWVSPNPAPVWLDLAREYTERWHHQQHIRDAVGKPGLKEPKLLSPVLDTFILALPRTFEKVKAENGALIRISIIGSFSKQWILKNGFSKWRLYEGSAADHQVDVMIEDDLVWRIFTKGISLAEAKQRVQIRGNQQLGEKVLETVSIIA